MAYNYKKIKLPDGTTRDEHRLVMEEYIGRKLKRNEIVHHKNGNMKDNKLENLELMSVSEHVSKHRKDGSISKTEEQIESIRRKVYPHNCFKCSKCGKIKPKQEFRKDKKTARGIQSACIRCKCEYDKIYNKTRKNCS